MPHQQAGPAFITPKGEPRKNFFRISHKPVESPQFKELKLSAQVLYFTLCRLRNRYASNKSGVFFRTDRQLAKDSGLNVSTIWRARPELVKKGFINWRQGKAHIACRYQIRDFEE